MLQLVRMILCVCAVGAPWLLTSGCGDEPLGPIGVSPTPTRTPSATITPTATATPRVLSSAEVLEPGAYGVGVTTTTFEDRSRGTMQNGSAPASPSRRLVTEIWYPTDAGESDDPQRDAPLADERRPFPLIMYSHGFMSFRTEGAMLARHLASHGYIVASPDFPLSNFNTPGGPTTADVPEQPGDVSFLIDELLARSADSSDEWFGAVDTERMGATGLSLGGLTTLLVTFHVSLHDAAFAPPHRLHRLVVFLPRPSTTLCRCR